jgi:hypothetical protein
MVEPVMATTPYRRWLAIRYNFCVSTKGVTLQQQPATSLPLKKRPLKLFEQSIVSCEFVNELCSHLRPLHRQDPSVFPLHSDSDVVA